MPPRLLLHREFTNRAEALAEFARIGLDPLLAQHISDRFGPRMLADDDLSGAADLGRVEWLEGIRVADHALDVNSGFMGEHVVPDNRMPWRRRMAGRPRQQVAQSLELGEVQTQIHAVKVAQAQGNLSNVGHSGAFADRIDRGMEIASPRLETGQRIGRGQTVIVMGMALQVDRHRLRDARHHRRVPAW